jgi:DNA-binding NarL/FixJ family response regulator
MSVGTLDKLEVSGQTHAAEDPVARFKIGGRICLVLKAAGAAGKDGSKELIRSLEEDQIIGRLEIEGEQYVVASCETSRSPNPGYSTRNPLDMLTQRELQIVMLVGRGCVNKQIADHLCISTWTVSTYLRRIFAKLGVDSRAAMIYRCARLLEISTDADG